MSKQWRSSACGKGKAGCTQLQRKSGTPQQDPHGSRGRGDTGVPHLPQEGFSKKPQVRAGRGETDYYLVQAYHFTDEISFLIPISHMALRLVSPGLNHKDRLLLLVVVFFKSGDIGQMTVSVPTTKNLLVPVGL